MALDSFVTRHRDAVAILAAALTLTVAALLGLAPSLLASPTATLVLALVLVVAAMLGDRVIGLVTAVAAALGYDFFLTEPVRTFGIDKTDDKAVTLLLLVMGFLVTELAQWARRTRERSWAERGYLDGLLNTGQLAHEGADPAALERAVLGRIVEVLHADDAVLVGPGRAGLRDDVVAVLHHDGSVTSGDEHLDVDRTGLPTDRRLLIPLAEGSVGTDEAALRRGRAVAVTVATHLSGADLARRRVAVALADRLPRS